MQNNQYLPNGTNEMPHDFTTILDVHIKFFLSDKILVSTCAAETYTIHVWKYIQ